MMTIISHFLSHRQVSITGTLTTQKEKGEHTLVRAAAAMTLALFRLFDFLLEKIMIHSFVVSSSVCGDNSWGS
jgi:hypothetical protein